jgi:hypothetical protein
MSVQVGCAERCCAHGADDTLSEQSAHPTRRLFSHSGHVRRGIRQAPTDRGSLARTKPIVLARRCNFTLEVVSTSRKKFFGKPKFGTYINHH